MKKIAHADHFFPNVEEIIINKKITYKKIFVYHCYSTTVQYNMFNTISIRFWVKELKKLSWIIEFWNNNGALALLDDKCGENRECLKLKTHIHFTAIREGSRNVFLKLVCTLLVSNEQFSSCPFGFFSNKFTKSTSTTIDNLLSCIRERFQIYCIIKHRFWCD